MNTRAVALPLLSPADGLRRYLQQIRTFPVLEEEEEYMLAKRWREHGDLAAAHRLTTSHLRLVAKIAMKFRGYGLPMGEMIAEGNIGLMHAVKRFEPDKGFRLATYAMWWIRASIQEFVLKSWSLVRIGSSAAQKRLFFNLRKIRHKIGAAHGGELSIEQAGEVAGMLNVQAADVIDMDRRLSGSDQSLNRKVGEEGDSEIIDLIADPAEAHDVALAQHEEDRNRHALLERSMALLNERERDILHARRLQDPPETLETLSKRYDISRERIRQIEMRAMEKLEHTMKRASLETAS